ncbi:response regulator [Mucilaginibacter sp. L3T2-6]|uniref:response regulator n=1 Tax=Mucilaginibacter sp. L3T2-6 TaxID=3062491 RepID=UPI002677138B|nr:response regulator [Mucilaginibacter sp. L3T2-6]MDO3641282.1 response regulator [Mucilaginibacter sp. L3T2-6]MDV6213958.1 response regulator [Mucilaginibacter sp. L3T2-6]
MQFNRILIVEDQDMANLSLRITLEGLGMPLPVHRYHTSHAILLLKKALLEKEPFDLLVTDLYFEDEGTAKQSPDGIELIRQAKRVQPELKVLVFSTESKIAVIRRLYEESGIDGFVRKARGDAGELKNALEQLSGNRRYYPRDYRSLAAKGNQHDFTDRDKEIIRLLNEGFSQREIADWLELNGMPPFGLSSVEKRLKLMREAMNFSKNQQLIGFCKDLGMI